MRTAHERRRSPPAGTVHRLCHAARIALVPRLDSRGSGAEGSAVDDPSPARVGIRCVDQPTAEPPIAPIRIQLSPAEGKGRVGRAHRSAAVVGRRLSLAKAERSTEAGMPPCRSSSAGSNASLPSAQSRTAFWRVAGVSAAAAVAGPTALPALESEPGLRGRPSLRGGASFDV